MSSIINIYVGGAMPSEKFGVKIFDATDPSPTAPTSQLAEQTSPPTQGSTIPTVFVDGHETYDNVKKIKFGKVTISHYQSMLCRLAMEFCEGVHIVDKMEMPVSNLSETLDEILKSTPKKAAATIPPTNIIIKKSAPKFGDESIFFGMKRGDGVKRLSVFMFLYDGSFWVNVRAFRSALAKLYAMVKKNINQYRNLLWIIKPVPQYSITLNMLNYVISDSWSETYTHLDQFYYFLYVTLAKYPLDSINTTLKWYYKTLDSENTPSMPSIGEGIHKQAIRIFGEENLQNIKNLMRDHFELVKKADQRNSRKRAASDAEDQDEAMVPIGSPPPSKRSIVMDEETMAGPSRNGGSATIIQTDHQYESDHEEYEDDEDNGYSSNDEKKAGSSQAPQCMNEKQTNQTLKNFLKINKSL